MILTYLIVFACSLLISFVLTWHIRNLALARGWVVPPTSGRHIHEVPLPRIGGVAIYLTFVTVIGGLIAASRLFHLHVGFSAYTIFILLCAGTIVFLLGLYDDIRPVQPYVKLAVQSSAAGLLFFEGFRVFQLPLFGWQQFGWVALPVTILWILWITNAFNLIDGLDGLAAGSALFSTLTVFVVSLIGHDSLVSLLTIGLAGAILGFLRFNFNPATIFLGDSGSLFIGFMLGALALAGSQKTPTIVAVAIPVVSFGLPILETTLSVLRRWLNGQPLFGADRQHIHHKLLERGLSQRQVVVILYGVSALCGLLSIFLLYPAGGTIGIVLVVLGVGIWIGVQHLGYQEFFEISRVAHRTMAQKKIIVNNLAVRRATQDLATAQSFAEIASALQSAFATSDFDGYELRLTPETLPPPRGAATSAPAVIWAKPLAANNSAANGAVGWMLNLELISSTQQPVGCFTLYREYNDRPLLFDINLLLSKFHTRLADAVACASSRAQMESENSPALLEPAAVAVPLLEPGDRVAESRVSK